MNIQAKYKFSFIIKSEQISNKIYKATMLMNEKGFTVGQCQLFNDEDFNEPCVHMGTKTDKGQVNLWLWRDEDYTTHCEITSEKNPEYALLLYQTLNC